MRGKVTKPAQRARQCWITPAYAGKSYTRTCYAYNVRDHPRVCGEKLICCPAAGAATGSPPRMRGKGPQRGPGRGAPGITPAYAGKRWGWYVSYAALRDHPRVCGEKGVEGLKVNSMPGSPPRMRGKAATADQLGSVKGITPAYAGKRLKRSHSIGHFSCILCLFHSVLHRASASGGSRAGPCAPPCLPAQNAVPV